MTAWQPIETAPKNATDVRLKNADGEKVGHYAEDLSGSEQPPFQGWFGRVMCPVHPDRVLYMRGITPEPTHWQPLPEPPATKAERG